jgi:hypothetical protein
MEKTTWVRVQGQWEDISHGDKESEMARILVDAAIKSYMEMFGVNRETLRESISNAAQVAD